MTRDTSSSAVAAARDRALRALKDAGIPNAAAEARELVARAAGFRPAAVDLRGRETFPPEADARLDTLVEQRRRRVPLAQVIGEWSFGDLVLEVTPDVLVPRPETEELLELVIKEMESARVRGCEGDPVTPVPSDPQTPLLFADVGTGSGCLAIALARAFPAATVQAVDVSEAALAVARRNAARHGVEGRVRFRQSDLLSFRSEDGAATLSAVVANLPYVASAVIEGLEPEVRREPRLALDGGADGLDLVRRLVPQAFARLKPGGRLFLEVGYDQADRVEALFGAAGFADVSTGRDMAGVRRFPHGRKPLRRRQTGDQRQKTGTKREARVSSSGSRVFGPVSHVRL